MLYADGTAAEEEEGMGVDDWECGGLEHKWRRARAEPCAVEDTGCGGVGGVTIIAITDSLAANTRSTPLNMHCVDCSIGDDSILRYDITELDHHDEEKYDRPEHTARSTDIWTRV